LLVMLYADEFRADRYLGTTAGLAGERFDTGVDGLCSLRLALSEQRDGRPYLRIWEQGDENAPADAHTFTLERDAKALRFGDGYHGVNPPSGHEVLVVSARVTAWEGGNVLPGSINRVAATAFAGVQVSNPLAASGGVAPQSSTALLSAIKEHLLAPRRAVGARDYRELAMSTPGLLISGVAVVSAAQYAAFYTGAAKPVGNVVHVVVKPTAAERPRLSESYRRAIEERLDAARLLTVRPLVAGAKYAGIEVYGRIVLSEDTPAARQGVLDAINGMIDSVEDCRFGGFVGQSSLFAHIESQPNVRYAYGITLSGADAHSHKTKEGDIAIAPDALAYLAKAELEFIGGVQ
jgi:hypothetical protein